MAITEVLAPPFSAARYVVRPSLELVVLDPDEDAAGIGALFANIEPWASYPIAGRDLTRFFACVEPGAPRFKIRHGGLIAGAIAIRTNWLCGPYLQTFGLAPMVQSRGHGTAILSFIEQEARANGDANLWVATSDFNTDAQRFYERFGFKRVAELDGLVRDERTEYLYRKRLDMPG